MTTTSTMTIRPTIKATRSPREGPEEESDAAGETLSVEFPSPGIGVAPHGSFRAFAPSAAAGFPPAAREPFTVMTWGTASVHVVTDRARPSYVVAEVAAPDVADLTSPSTLRETEMRVREEPKALRYSARVRSVRAESTKAPESWRVNSDSSCARVYMSCM